MTVYQGGIKMNKPTITIEELDELRIIYIRFRGSYVQFRKNSRKLFNTLFTFASKYDLIVEDVTKVLTMYNDNPFITKADDLRTSIAMTIPRDAVVEEEDEICITTISGKFAVGHFEIAAKEYAEAWEYMYHEYLFKSGEKPRDAIPFELYVSQPSMKLNVKSFTDIYIPIES